MKKVVVLSACAIVLLVFQACAPRISQQQPAAHSSNLSELVSAEDLEKYFTTFDSGTMVLSDGVSQVIYNKKLSLVRRSPYSTFKILNALIALEKGVVTIDNSMRKWDGTQHSRPELNRDQDLASAMKYSAIWYYQQLAQEIGENAMQNYLNKIGYGNMDISGGIDQFWLSSSLLISAQEQVNFIACLYRNELPFSQENMEYVKSILRQTGYPIDVYGKTGSSGNGDGWFVGYALIHKKPYFFAAYIEGKNATSSLARNITIEIIDTFLN